MSGMHVMACLSVQFGCEKGYRMSHDTDITPYADHDVPQVLNHLLDDSEFIDAIGRFRFKRWYRWIRPMVFQRVREAVRQRTDHIDSIAAFQSALEPVLAQILSQTTETFTVSGLESLDPTHAYLFLSNHRDIAMDPACVNWALYSSGFETVRIAIGDNLVQKAFVGDLMRLNKSFIVRRDVSGPRAMLKTYSALSSYIRDSLDSGHPVWIAHREGRAKDGIDRTDPAILKMLSMAGKARQEPFARALQTLRIVPVSISYEFDPCAPLKARELALTERHGHYVKTANEDIQSIATGIMGWKGRVHLHFGSVIDAVPDTPSELAHYVDHQIAVGQKIFDTGRLADAMLKQQSHPLDVMPDVARRFEKLIRRTPSEYKTKLLEIYANPFRQFTLHQEC
jgi:1-acyl-sn-glycerol-3-phosphate acyltransferase